LRRLSGPLLDRFDLRVPVARPSVDDLLDGRSGEPTAVVAARVAVARRAALDRAGRLNAELHGESLDELAPLTPPARDRLRDEMERERLTGRGYHRIRRVARTIADLAGAGAEPIDLEHVEVALSLRVRLRTTPAGVAA
jgi:magnesium chelatase family protein